MNRRQLLATLPTVAIAGGSSSDEDPPPNALQEENYRFRNSCYRKH